MADDTTTQETLQPELEPSTIQTLESEASAEALAQTADFDDWNLDENLRKALSDMGYERPMPVQIAVFNILTAGKDLMVQSKTGSGKTSAFGIPIAQLLASGKKGVQSLILAPTRELAMQVAKEVELLTQHMDVSVVPVYGGAPITPQINKLKAGAQIVAGTPGRVLDHIRRKTLDTSGIRMLVLDECDEMLSMGFQEEIENIISYLPAKEDRQTLLFSATIPKEIERIGRRHMNDPEMLSLSTDSVGVDLIDHYYYVVSGMARTRDLLKLMKAERPDSAIIFCNTREETNSVARYLQRHGYDAEPLSSDLSQSDRERVMARMRAKNLNFLVATDIAARGIDISELSHVINYTFPASPEVYVHRSGRTGRAGKMGTALSLVGPREIGAFYYLKLIYKIIPTERELPTADEMATIEEGEQYEKVVQMLPAKPRSEYLGLARRLWQSTEGERVVALLLQDLLTEKKDSPALAATASPAPAAGTDRVVDARPSTSTSEDRPRRGRGDREPRAEREARSDREPRAEREARSDREPRAEREPRADREARSDREPQAEREPRADREEFSDATAPQMDGDRPRRKRRRRRGTSEDADVSLSAAGDSLAGDVELAEQDSIDEAQADVGLGRQEELTREASDADSDASAALAAESSESSESESDESSEAVERDAMPASDEERPRRKRRRRRGGATEAGSDEDSADALPPARRDARPAPTLSAKAEPAAPSKSQATPAKAESTTAKVSSPAAKTPAGKAAKRRPRKQPIDPGAHVEFWEAWAETKSSVDSLDTEDDDEAEDTGKSGPSLQVARGAEEDSEGGKKRRRRRRGKSTRGEARDADDESSGEGSDESLGDESPGDESPVEASPARPASDDAETPKRAPRAKRAASVGDEEQELEGDLPAGDSVRLFVNVGKREDADAEEIHAFLREALGDKAEGLGRITLRNTHCYVRVRNDIADEVIEACTGLLFKEREMVVERAKR